MEFKEIPYFIDSFLIFLKFKPFSSTYITIKVYLQYPTQFIFTFPLINQYE